MNFENSSDDNMSTFSYDDVRFFEHELLETSKNLCLENISEKSIKNNSILDGFRPEAKYTRLKDLKPNGTYDVYGIVLETRPQSITRIDGYSKSIFITDGYFDDEITIMCCVVFRSDPIDFPDVNIFDVIEFRNIKYAQYNDDYNLKTARNTNITVFNRDLILRALESPHELPLELFNFIKQLENNSADLPELSTFENCLQLSQFINVVLVLGVYRSFKNTDILVVTDGTKSKIDFYVDQDLQNFNEINLSVQHMINYIDLCQYVFIDTKHKKILEGIKPLKYYKLFLMAEEIDGKLLLKATPAPKRLFFYQKMDDSSIETQIINSRLSKYSTSEMEKSILTLPTQYTNNGTLNNKIRTQQSDVSCDSEQSEYSQTIFKKINVNIISSDDKNQFTQVKFQLSMTDKFDGIKKSNLREILLDRDDLYNHILHVSVEIFHIRPCTLNEAIKTTCTTCYRKLLLSTYNGSYKKLYCHFCKQFYPLQLLYIVFLRENGVFLPTILCQEKALKFFGLECDLDDITPYICGAYDRIIQSRLKTIVTNHETESKIREVYLLKRKYFELLGNSQRSVSVYEVCAVE